MSTLAVTTPTDFPILRWNQRSLYLWGVAFVTGNLALPQLCHLAALGGKIWLPVYLFTLLASACFGWRAGLLTALASPLLNNLLFGMPPNAALLVITVKSLLIVAFLPVLLRHFAIVPAVLLAVAGYQSVGALFEWLWTGSSAAALQDIRLGWPGMVAQVLITIAVLAIVARKSVGSAANRASA
ncbi:MAG: hypothetical protein LBS59_08185 [Puniceicoccales bacterium]|jgi:hypothetical protein|nr:hypothetical protein [Puniceicoccales bacterium]